ncbi:uncharacterized protein [Montipora foliosa]|uniref:uncharacterized protein n=1 Tax=Montipora foliosa TaxID=591990 RepID=UPI0035F100AF
MGSIIKNHNKKILNNNSTSQNGCNCRKKDQCPLDNNCLITSVIYKANVTTDKDNTGKYYIGLTEGTFKQGYTQPNLSFRNRKYASRTKLAKHIWKLKDNEVDIAALQETRRSGTGQLSEHGGGYTFYWQGRPEGQPRIHGVGFAIRSELTKYVTSLPHGVNERIMKMRLSLDKDQGATVICAYAPTLDAEEETKEVFYATLNNILAIIHKDDKIIILGDFNTRVGTDHALWKGTIGREGVGNCNANGVFLLTCCEEHQVVITNTIFRQKNKFKTTWQHRRSKHWHLIDFVIVRARDQGDVQITKSITSADDSWTDHRLVRSSFALKLHHKKRHIAKQPKRRLDVERLKDPALLEELQLALRLSLASVHGNNVEEFWQALKAVILSSSEATIAYSTRKHQDWFDENDYVIEMLIDGKRKAFFTWQSDPTNETNALPITTYGQRSKGGFAI